MPCDDLDELISAYADGQTVSAQSDFVEAHLSSCARCQAVLRRHRQTLRLLHLLNDNVWTPPDMRLRVVHAYRGRQRRWHPAQVGIVAATAAIAVLLLGVLGGQVLGPHTAAPQRLAPIAHVAAAVRPLPATAQRPAPPGLEVAVADWTKCQRLSIDKMALCLGVSRQWLPTVLAEEIDYAIPAHSRGAQVPVHPLLGSTSSTTSYSTRKGGGARIVLTPIHGGLQPI